MVILKVSSVHQLSSQSRQNLPGELHKDHSLVWSSSSLPLIISPYATMPTWKTRSCWHVFS